MLRHSFPSDHPEISHPKKQGKFRYNHLAFYSMGYYLFAITYITMAQKILSFIP